MIFILKDETIMNNCCKQIYNSLGMEVVIRKAKRSNPQNNLYWSLLEVLADYTGDTKEDLHDRLRVEFIGVERKTVKGVDLVYPISTTSLDKKQFKEYLDKVYMIGETLGIKLPYPDHYGYET